MVQPFHAARRAAWSLVLVASLPLSALAQGAVPQNLKLMVGFGAGGGVDVIARIWADGLRDTLKVNAVVENKPGAGGALAAQGAVQAPAGQPTLLVAIDHQVAILQHIMKNPGFDAERDLVPIGRIATYEVCLAVNAAVPVRNPAEYAAAVRADPSVGNVAVPAPGSNAQFVAHAIGQHYGLKLVPVPYRGAAPALPELAGGQIKAAVMPCDAFRAFVQQGSVRVIGIAGDKRSARLPDVPAMQEFGITIPGTNNFIAAYAPKSIDARAVAALADATREMFKSAAWVERINGTGQFAAYASPEEVVQHTRRASAFWAEQVKSSGYVAE